MCGSVSWSHGFRGLEGCTRAHGAEEHPSGVPTLRERLALGGTHRRLAMPCGTPGRTAGAASRPDVPCARRPQGAGDQDAGRRDDSDFP